MSEHPKYEVVGSRYWKCVVKGCVHTEATKLYRLVYPDGTKQLKGAAYPKCPDHRLSMTLCPKDEYNARNTPQ